MSALSNARMICAAGVIALLCAACFGGSDSASPDSPDAGPPPPAANRPPTISGSPMTSLIVGQAYDFQPTASDPDGDTLTFSIQNRPGWATFNGGTGRLTGTPGAGDVGQFGNVRITVSDGQAQASLDLFSIAVNQVAMGSVTLSWLPPTTNSDGSTITDLSGYRIYYGRSSGNLDEMVVVSNAGTTRWVVDNLSAATWYFSMTSYNSSGIESVRSTTVSRPVS